MCSIDFPLSQMMSIAISLLNVIFYSSIVAVKRNSGIECLLHTSYVSEIIFSSLLTSLAM